MSEDNPHSSNGASKKGWLDKISQLFKEEPQNREDLVQLIQHAQEKNLINQDSRQMLEGVLEVSDLRVRDIMIPRSQMITIEICQPLEELLPLVVDSAHSRFPVIGEDKDHVEGILHAKDLLAYTYKKTDQQFDFTKILRKAVVVPESKRVDILLKEFRSKRYHMAIVIDEYGGVSGLVTIEDILELIVGEIEDEFDADDHQHDIRQINRKVFAIQALTPIADFNDYFGTEFSDDEFDTVGGMLSHAFGHMPGRGETITLNGIQFKVVQADKRRIRQLQVRMPTHAKSGEAAEL
ncbi:MULTISPECIES: CNNM family magnesium/cobalt transport protein CorC [Corallincola]|uniref:Magnesium and cobalt efflux protein CorC n=3 Tax=Corallincola TaxID=1775176 RepID=A0A368NFX5_9GAMM|nr:MULTISPECIES: CNNM family magnesium/cobalt transport protein CorC [Corallincola]RCU48823.1 magnesium/cobalt transporter CorC [Corallincola holothuriorum]TAA43718.1 magnesium/cobalt transporter CorC [Corallincola spongiicola]TCI02965.1 magnesium/cobalt transporter CorC [Corallincola luteus]